MIYINVGSVFAEGYDDALTILTTVGMGRSILDAFSEDIVFVDTIGIVVPYEYQSELIESGIGDITTALVL